MLLHFFPAVLAYNLAVWENFRNREALLQIQSTFYNVFWHHFSGEKSVRYSNSIKILKPIFVEGVEKRNELKKFILQL